MSLNQPVGDDGGGEFGDLLRTTGRRSIPASYAEASLRRKAVHAALAELPERERRVLELRFGLGGEPHVARRDRARARHVSASASASSRGPRSAVSRVTCARSRATRWRRAAGSRSPPDLPLPPLAGDHEQVLVGVLGRPAGRRPGSPGSRTRAPRGRAPPRGRARPARLAQSAMIGPNVSLKSSMYARGLVGPLDVLPRASARATRRVAEELAHVLLAAPQRSAAGRRAAARGA